MNKERRKRLEGCCSILEDVIEEEQESFDNLSDNLRYAGMGEKMEENIDELEDAKCTIEQVILK